MFSCKPVYPPVTGWLEVGLSTEALQYLYNRIADAKGSAKGDLAGHISSSLEGLTYFKVSLGKLIIF